MLIVVLSGDFVIQVVSTFPEGDAGHAGRPRRAALRRPIGVAIALFLALAAIDHL